MAEGPDRGRAWFVALAAMMINMITAGIFRAQGLLFVEFISQYNVDRQGAAVPFSVRTAIRNLLAPVVGVFGQKYGVPTVTVIGGILGTLSCALCFFATDMLWITVIWGVINGMAAALITVLPQVVIGQYFQKYRTTASGLSFSGGCMGSFVFPALLEFLLQYYGLSGTFFILAGMIMHTIPAAMLLSKPSWLKANGKHELQSCCEKSKGGVVPKDSKILSNDIKLTHNNHPVNPKVTFHLGDETETKHHLPSSLAMNSLYPMNDFTHPMQINNHHLTPIPTISSLSMNNRLLKSSTENFFDIDLDYLKLMGDLLFQMFAMELPNIEMSYRAILLEVEQDDLWHPEKHEITQEIESLYIHLEKSLEIEKISETTIKAKGLYIKRTLLSGALSVSKKSQSLRAVRKYFKTYKGRGLHFGKNRSAPNISNIYNELVRKDYILSKLRLLCNSNEIRIISHLSEYNPRDVLKVLFQLRSLYILYNELESSDQLESSEFSDFLSDIKQLCDEQEILEKPVEPSIPIKEPNTFGLHIKNALMLHKNPIFLLICFTRAAFFVTFNPVITTIVDFAMDRGLKEEDGKYIIIALSFGDLLGRLGLGWITDRGYATLSRYMIAVLILLGVNCFSIPMMNTKWTLFPSISLFGMLQGSLFIRHPVLVAKYLKAHEQSIAVGCMEFSSGVLCLLIPMYIGYFRDTLGSYNPIYYTNGVIAILAGLSWLSEPYISRRRNDDK